MLKEDSTSNAREADTAANPTGLFHGIFSPDSNSIADLVGNYPSNAYHGTSDWAHREMEDLGRSIFYVRDWPYYRLRRSDTATYCVAVPRDSDWLFGHRADRPRSGGERKGARRGGP